MAKKRMACRRCRQPVKKHRFGAEARRADLHEQCEPIASPPTFTFHTTVDYRAAGGEGVPILPGKASRLFMSTRYLS